MNSLQAGIPDGLGRRCNVSVATHATANETMASPKVTR